MFINDIKDQTFDLWDSFFEGEADLFEEAWAAVQSLSPARGGLPEIPQGMLFALRVYREGRGRERERQMAQGDLAERARASPPKEEGFSLPADPADTLRLRVMVQDEMLHCHFGERVWRFRADFTGGRVLTRSEADVFIQEAVRRARETPPSLGQTLMIGREFYSGLLDAEVAAGERSCLGQAFRLARRLEGRYGWRLEQGVMFLFTADVPEMAPLRLRPNIDTLADALAFSSQGTTPIIIHVMPWVAPEKVARCLQAWQRASWVGKTKTAKVSGLKRLSFVLSEHHKRQARVLDQSARRSIFDSWLRTSEAEAHEECVPSLEEHTLPSPKDDIPLSLKEDASRLFAEVERTLRLLTRAVPEA